MNTDKRGQAILRWHSGSVWLLVIAWALLSIDWKFHVARLAAYEGPLDAMFLIGLSGSALTWSVERWGLSRTRSGLWRAGLALVTIAVMFVASELVARVVFRNVHSTADPRDYFGHRGGGPPMHINNLGFRDRNVGPRSPDRDPIAIVGDSFTWGQGIEERERYSDLLREYLGPRYEVLNLGIPGNNLPEHVQVLQRALAVSPDFVLLQLYINDFEMPDMDRPNADPLLPWPDVDAWLLRSSVIYDLVNREWEQVEAATVLSESYAHYMERNLRDPNSPHLREGLGLLRQFIEGARDHGVPVGTVLFPSPALLSRGYPFGYLHDQVGATCDEEQIPCLDLLGPFAAAFKDPQRMWVSRFDQHPNARANEKAAQEILARFGALWHRATAPGKSRSSG